MAELIGPDELLETLDEVMSESGGNIQQDGSGIRESLEGLGIDYDAISVAVKNMFGKELGALWLSAFHAGLLVASKYWTYRVPEE